ncbi:MAG: hypothetical protein KDD64_08645 [Bdellovibrionales bacterium]|nr:hypothetical protein [Bdellovibrionales bacterium]
MLEWAQGHFVELLQQLVEVETDLLLLAIILVCAVIVLDAVSLFNRKLQKEVGLDRSSDVFSIDGSKTVPSKNYVSEIQTRCDRS